MMRKKEKILQNLKLYWKYNGVPIKILKKTPRKDEYIVLLLGKEYEHLDIKLKVQEANITNKKPIDYLSVNDSVILRKKVSKNFLKGDVCKIEAIGEKEILLRKFHTDDRISIKKENSIQKIELWSNPKKPRGFSKITKKRIPKTYFKPSKDLQEFFDGEDDKISYSEAMRKVWRFIRYKKCIDKTKLLPINGFEKIIGKRPIKMFGLNKYISKHLIELWRL